MSGFEELGFSVAYGKVRGVRVGYHPSPLCQVANGDTENSLAFMYRPAWRIIHTGGLSTASPRRARSISGSEEEPCFVFEGERLTKVRDKEEIRIERSRRRRRKRGGERRRFFWRQDQSTTRRTVSRDLGFAFLLPQRSRKTLQYPFACQSSSQLLARELESWIRAPRECATELTPR